MRTVHIYCGQTWEPVHPDMLEDGAGGSELALLRLAHAFAARGIKVVIFTESQVRDDGNISIRKLSSWSSSAAPDLLIMWRQVHPVRGLWRSQAKCIVAWLHDLVVQELPPAILDRMHAIICLSEFHANWVRARSASWATKVQIIPNGINISDFEFPNVGAVSRDLNRLFYGSSPTRGLGVLAQNWAEWKKEFPNLELHVAYGFDLQARITEAQQGKEAAQRVIALREYMRELPGVTLHGRLSPKNLRALQSTCGIWAYPPDPFEETFCITAYESVLSGLLPVTRRNGALASFPGIHWEKPEDFPAIMRSLLGGANSLELGQSLAQEAYTTVLKTICSWDNVAHRFIVCAAQK